MFPIFSKLGGADRALGVLERQRGWRLTLKAVHAWRAAGRIPAINRLHLMDEADRRGIAYTARDFEPETPVQRRRGPPPTKLRRAS
jgi:hypothetical protein